MGGCRVRAPTTKNIPYDGQSLTLDEKEVLALRKYLTRGGFLIIDDSREDADRGNSGWANMVAMLQLVLPDLHPIDLENNDPKQRLLVMINFNTDISKYWIGCQMLIAGECRPVARIGNGAVTRCREMGSSCQSWQRGRQAPAINISAALHYWEYSALGFMPMEESNEAYELGVNYLFYALTH